MENPRHWHEALSLCKRRNEPFVLATVLSAAGSTPRNTDAKMVITRDQQFDTIGGGRLEFKTVHMARERIAAGTEGPSVEKFALGSQLGQCCGGQVSVLLEGFPGCPFRIGLFGAGHVAKALTKILAELPCQVEWVDSRLEQFPDNLPDNILPRPARDPVSWVPRLSAGTHMVVMTHDHDLDFELVHAGLQRQEMGSIGVIGSGTKARRFRRRLHDIGMEDALRDRLTCPIGLPEVPGKQPMEVAVSIAGQLIAWSHADDPRAGWRGLDKTTLKEGIG
ncbi:xanthine dehydrogenase accessory protein XdhC [Spiribacter aquaticus]|uniref:Xanthine dehydrogenase accessory protein XdhC n=1 Tax=Spiribacter aquaticus TaxID=1935996 RepID=A0A557RMR6_9GAMM|nr:MULTISPECIES: xanthine dehydrogenase accessory protein XdhC [Spiribacter]TVO66457.1 xanthine dehydrogenase accessory protein XdhC [Spiribacter aquaticus]